MCIWTGFLLQILGKLKLTATLWLWFILFIYLWSVGRTAVSISRFSNMSGVWTADICSPASRDCLMAGDSLCSFHKETRGWHSLKSSTYSKGTLHVSRNGCYFSFLPTYSTPQLRLTAPIFHKFPIIGCLLAKQAERDVESMFLCWRMGEQELLCYRYLLLCCIHCSALCSWILPSGALTELQSKQYFVVKCSNPLIFKLKILTWR